MGQNRSRSSELQAKQQTKSELPKQSAFAAVVIDRLQHETFLRDVELAGILVVRSCIALSMLSICNSLHPLIIFAACRKCQRSNWKQHKLMCGKPLDYDTAIKLATSPTISNDASDILPPANGFKPP